MMRVTLVGHGTVLIEAQGQRIVVDPWMEDSIYFHTWVHWPQTVMQAADVFPVDHAIISHVHPDHASPLGLRRCARPGTKVLIHDFTSTKLTTRLERYAITPAARCQSRQRHDAGPFAVTFFRSDRAYEDSAQVIEVGGLTLFMQNDCMLSPETFAEIGRRWKVDIAFLSFAGGDSLFPIVYDIFTREQKVEIATKKAQASLNGFCEAARRLAPRYVVPYADGWRRGGFDAGWIDQINVRNNPYVAKRELEARLDGAPTRCVIMNPGDYFSEAEGFVTIDPSRLEQRGQVESPYPPLAPIEEIELRERLERHFRTAFERCFDVTKTLRRRLLFEFVGPGQFHPFQVNFEGGTLGFGTAAEWSDRMRIDERLLGEVLRSDDPLLWEELLVSWRYTLARKTDELCRPLWSGLMSYPDPAYVRLFA